MLHTLDLACFLLDEPSFESWLARLDIEKRFIEKYSYVASEADKKSFLADTPRRHVTHEHTNTMTVAPPSCGTIN